MNNNYLMLERGVNYHENKYHLFDGSKHQRDFYCKHIIVNYEEKNENGCFDDILTIKCSISENNSQIYVAKTYDRKEC